MIEGTETREEIDEQELEAAREAQLRLHPLPKFEHEAGPVSSGSVGEVEICRAAAKMIRQFLLGYTLAEIEAMYPQNSVEVAEDGNMDVHNGAVKRLESIAAELDPPVKNPLRPLAPKTPSLSFLMPALRWQIR